MQLQLYTSLHLYGVQPLDPAIIIAFILHIRVFTALCVHYLICKLYNNPVQYSVIIVSILWEEQWG